MLFLGFLRLIGIFLICSGVCLSIVLFIRFFSTPSHTVLDHPLLKKSCYLILNGNHHKTWKLESDLEGLWPPFVFLHVPVRYDRQRGWKVLDVTLSNFLKRHKRRQFLLRIESEDIDSTKELMDELTQQEIFKTSLIYSTSYRAMRTMKEAHPYWVFGPHSQIEFFPNLFASFSLEALIDLDRDFYFLIQKDRLWNFSEKSLEELSARGKKVFYRGSLEALVEKDWSRFIHGYFAEDLKKGRATLRSLVPWCQI